MTHQRIPGKIDDDTGFKMPATIAESDVLDEVSDVLAKMGYPGGPR